MGSAIIISEFAVFILWLLGFVILWRLHRVSAVQKIHAWPKISIIIPARNEENNLPTLLSSLVRQQKQADEIIVVDDGSTDKTVEVAHKFGAKVITSKQIPENWQPKSWACQQGAEAASGDLLMFLDADTWLEPDGLNRIIATYPGGAFSLAPYHAVKSFYEHGSLFFNICMVIGTVPKGIFGQMLLVDAASFRRVQGYKSVHNRMLENYCLAAGFIEQAIPVRSEVGTGAVGIRMYPNGLKSLAQGWLKSFALGARQSPQSSLFLVVLWMIGLVLEPLCWVATGTFHPWAVLYLLNSLQIAVIGHRIGSFRWFYALLYPVPLLFFFILFTWSAIKSGKKVTWKGRQISAD